MLQDKIIFITGASSGIGAACAKYFAQANAKLVLAARDLNKLHSLARQLKNEHSTLAYCLQLDIRDYSQVKQTLELLPNEWKNINILINNAGLAAGFQTLQDGSLDDWEQMIDTNIKGLLYVTKEVLPKMIAMNSGHIINIGSVAGHQTYPKGAVYCATKYAVNALSSGLRMDLLGTKIRVSTVDPGMVETNFSLTRFKGDENLASAVYAGMTPLSADDVADAVFYCATRPAHVNINEIIIMPTDQASATMVARQS